MPGVKKQATLFDYGRSQSRRFSDVNAETDVKHKSRASKIACPVCDSCMDSFTMENRIRHVEECLSMATIKETRNTNERFEPGSMQEIKSETANLTESCTIKAEPAVEIIDVSDEADSDDKQKLVISKKIGRRASVRKDYKTDLKKEPQKRKRDLGPPQKERLRYVNSQPTVKRKKQNTSKAETNEVEQFSSESLQLLPCSRKNAIPDLKIMKFPVHGSETYKLSVDAFSYKPHDEISQYFLSHFHSDHYGGITKKWCRERTTDKKIIYCSSITGRLLNIRYSVEECHLFSMENDVRYKIKSFTEVLENGGKASKDKTPGVYVTCIDANHCPGAVIFLFEGICLDGVSIFSLHCGDFRVNKNIMTHPLLSKFLLGAGHHLENVYLDTTYMTPKYNFPKQEQVCDSVATLIHELSTNEVVVKEVFGATMQSRITDFLSLGTKATQKKYLILVGTYLIGKEKLAVSISKRLGNSPIYVSNVNSRGDKEHIVRSYRDPYLDSVLTKDPVSMSDHHVMIHLVPMKIAGNIEELHKYFNHNAYHHHFQRCIGLRPTGWSFKDNEKDENGIITSSRQKKNVKIAQNGISTDTVNDHTPELIEIDETAMSLQATAGLLRKQPSYDYRDVLSQNPNKRTNKVDKTTFRIYSVPYSEHSSFRELSFFVVFLNIKNVIPTVNTANPHSAKAMAEIIHRWETIRRIIMGDVQGVADSVKDSVNGLSIEHF